LNASSMASISSAIGSRFSICSFLRTKTIELAPFALCRDRGSYSLRTTEISKESRRRAVDGRLVGLLSWKNGADWKRVPLKGRHD
jgi:hypothetical protein